MRAHRIDASTVRISVTLGAGICKESRAIGSTLTVTVRTCTYTTSEAGFHTQYQDLEFLFDKHDPDLTSQPALRNCSVCDVAELDLGYIRLA